MLDSPFDAFEAFGSPFGRRRFTPSALFRSGEAGIWLEPSVTSCFQDAAGTTPAGAGDPVGRINDLSGNGHHATQSTSASRPTLQQTAGGLWYLDFDGVDDVLNFGDILKLGTSDKTLAIALVDEHGSSNASFFSRRGSSAPGSAPGWGFRSSSGTMALEYDDGTANSLIANVGSPAGLETLAVQIAAVEHGVEARNYKNGAADGAALDISAIGDVTGSESLGVGNNPLDVFPITGRIYGLVFVDRLLTSEEKARITSYLAARSGVTL